MTKARLGAQCALLVVVGICLNFCAHIASAESTGNSGCPTSRPSWSDLFSCKTQPDISWPVDHKWSLDLIGSGDCSGKHPTTRPDCANSDSADLDADIAAWKDWWKSVLADCSGSSGSSTDSQTDNTPPLCTIWPHHDDTAASCAGSGDTTTDDTTGTGDTSGNCTPKGSDPTSCDVTTSNEAAVTVPEPATLGIFAMASATILSRRRRD